jgi:tetratricopeptide (TPR) repeat protein
MMRFVDAAWMIAGWITATTAPAAPSPSSLAFVKTTTTTTTTTMTTSMIHSSNGVDALSQGVSQWIASSTTTQEQPSADDVQLLRQAFAEFYNPNIATRNLEKSEQLLSQAIEIWNDQRHPQPADEVAGLYRVRGDCYMALSKAQLAYADYDQAVRLLQSSSSPSVLEAAAADPAELTASLLGRARSVKASLNSPDVAAATISTKQIQQAARDLEQVLKLSSREAWDDEQDLLEDGATRNPYAAWEWGSLLRKTQDWNAASQAHFLAAQAFDAIGDKPRAAISYVDAGIDLAAAVTAAASGGTSEESWKQATATLQQAIKKTIGVSSKDVDLLNRVITKEGEGGMALAALLWTSSNSDNRAEAERVLGETCNRLEQQWVQKIDKSTKVTTATKTVAAVTTAETKTALLPSLRFSIDDDTPNMDVSCFRFKNPAFLNQLDWPVELQQKVIKLETLR